MATPASWSTTSARRSSAAEPRNGGGSAPGPATGAIPCHAGRNRAERGRVDRLDLAAQPRQRASAQEAQDVRVAPLALRAARPELAAQDRAGGEQPLERVLDDADRQAPPGRRLGRQERPVGPRVAGKQPVERGRPPVRGTPRARPTGAVTPTPSR